MPEQLNLVKDSVDNSIDKSEAFSNALTTCREALKKLPSKDAKDLIKALGAMHNMHFVFAFAPTGPVQRPPVSGDTRKQVKPRMRSKNSPQVKNIRNEIKDINSEISKKSKEEFNGCFLPDEHPLIMRRHKFFRDLQDARNNPLGSFFEGTQESL
jgi:hypothetical protein